MIVRSTHPSRGSAQIPQEVAELLGVSREDLAVATKPGRAIVFLARDLPTAPLTERPWQGASSEDRPSRPEGRVGRSENGGPGALRVVGARKDAKLVAEAMERGTAVAKATLTKTQIFNIPQAVYRHLGVRTREMGYGVPPGTDDQIAWTLPEEEYAALRQGKAPAEPHVMLLKAHLEGILPPVEELERSRSRRPKG